ncbi:lysozyme inhibitor LprI family protein [Cronobacter dublinensis]|uniref:lysozyme inhibitor LprI family protein n=1 Tax=Cronobacter dublinensis TaxID=413497 RepID=UPI000D006FFB|nr:lysozyme inhibitor LprI family protein [Cronobacter dublinensis]ELY2856428.1 DUF1311 domain-containing protein [Cronobacter dublinensis]NHV91512.1 DUF1311 domain-containing protein [Cronobacter dublinensis]
MRYFRLLILISLTLSPLFAQGGIASSDEASVMGQWGVVSVRVDNLASTNNGVVADDPHYVGRKVSFSNDKIGGNLDASVTCAQPDYLVQNSIKLSELIKQTSAKRYTKQEIPAPEDFKLKEQTVTPVLIKCQSGKFNPASDKIGGWVTKIDADTLLTYWYENSYLLMKRVNPVDKVSPSFSCKVNLNSTEKAICSDDELASWDNSVTQAYKTVVWQKKKITPDDTAALNKIKNDQGVWIKERNKCGSDKECIEKSIKERIDFLTQQSM